MLDNLRTNKDARTIFVTLKTHWPWTFAGLMLAALAVIGARRMSGDRQEFAASVLHTPLPLMEANKHLIPVNEPKSLGNLIKSPAALQAAIDEHEIDLTPQALAERIEVKTVPGSQTIVVGMQWKGPGDGAAVLNTVLGEFVKRAGETRHKRIEERTVDFASSKALCDQEVESIRQKLNSFYKANNVADLTHELRTTTHELEVLLVEYSQSRRSESSSKARIADINKTIERLMGENKAEGGSRQTPHRIQQLIEEERHREQCQSRLEIKLRALERIQKLRDNGAASQTEVDVIKGDIAALQASVKDNDKIKEWKEELVLIEKSGTAPSPVLQQAFAKKLDLDLELLGHREELAHLTADRDAKQARVGQLLALQSQAVPLSSALEHAEAERNRLQSHVNQLRVLTAMTGGEARLHQSAAMVSKPMSGIRGWLMPLAVGGCALLLWCTAMVALRPREAVNAPSVHELPYIAASRPPSPSALRKRSSNNFTWSAAGL